jgi:hypothetical protein
MTLAISWVAPPTSMQTVGPASTSSTSRHFLAASSQPNSHTSLTLTLPCALQVIRLEPTHSTVFGSHFSQSICTRASASLQSVPGIAPSGGSMSP